LEEVHDRVWSGDPALTSVFREPEPGKPQLMAQGYESEVPMSVEVEGKRREWSERRLVVRSLRHVEAAEAALRARVAKAKAQDEALNQRGRGRKRFEEMETSRQAVNEIVQRHRVEDFLWLRYDQHTTTRSVRAYKDRPAYDQENRQATVEVRVDEEALESSVRQLG
jgi:transposase